LPGVEHVEAYGERVQLRTGRASQTVIELVRLLDSRGNGLVDLHIHKPSLEDVFIELTGSRLRD
jgi:ABC-2 type transport system ATP-binding protein